MISNYTAIDGFNIVSTSDCALLMDNTVETVGVDASELVLTGNFSSDTNWTDFTNGSTGGTIVITGGELVITEGSNSVWMGAYQAITTVVGQYYSFSVTKTVGTTASRIGAASWNQSPTAKPGIQSFSRPCRAVPTR